MRDIIIVVLLVVGMLFVVPLCVAIPALVPGPAGQALETAVAQLPTPTPTSVPPISADYGCTNPEDLNRFPPGDQVRVIREEAYLVEDPSVDHPVVTGIVQVGDILIVHENDMGIHCAVIDGIALYYGIRLDNINRPPARGFFHPDEVQTDPE